ncbi:hypothetical protein A9G11_03405 [Gilliamella sp. wkB108]|uniref:hypothetical protein n=1 Tax=Gilliamella sp. wkB108 TaxID=3120256 RepID=UPI00080ECF8F|nr:hypothetical protein [Gilliamella apicola]OCG24713.1 hypothetical protein A9G11_03405 [Gilliamella apicola]
MVGFAKLGIFEQAAKFPVLSINELALILCSVDPNKKIKEIPVDIKDDFNSYKNQIKRCLNRHPDRYNSYIDSDIMYALAYPLIDKDETPEPIRKRTEEAVYRITKIYPKEWKNILFYLGGQELLQTGYDFSKSQRGQYKKDEEQINIYKMTGMLLKLLAKKQGNAYGTVDNPNIATIKKEIKDLAKTHNLSLDGLSKSSFYEKAKIALSYTLD